MSWVQDARKALADLDAVIQRDPKNERALQWRAHAWQDLGENQKAVADLDAIQTSLGELVPAVIANP